MVGVSRAMDLWWLVVNNASCVKLSLGTWLTKNIQSGVYLALHHGSLVLMVNNAGCDTRSVSTWLTKNNNQVSTSHCTIDLWYSW